MNIIQGIYTTEPPPNARLIGYSRRAKVGDFATVKSWLKETQEGLESQLGSNEEVAIYGARTSMRDGDVIIEGTVCVVPKRRTKLPRSA